LLETDHSCAILQQLIPSTVYTKYDHTYCHVNLERLSDPPPTINPVAVSPFPTITTQQRHSVLLELSVTESERLKSLQLEINLTLPFGMKYEQTYYRFQIW